MGNHPFRLTFRTAPGTKARRLMWTRYGADHATVLAGSLDALVQGYPTAYVESVECLTVAFGPQGFQRVDAMARDLVAAAAEAR